MDFLDAARSRFAPALAPHLPEGESVESFLDLIRPARDAQFGDFQANFAMPLAKRAKKPPRDLAAEIVAAADLTDLFDQPEVAGPGFINLRVRDDVLAAETAKLAADERLGVPIVENPQTITVDFSSPNVAKPMHVGHLRTTVIGDAVCRILRLRGHNVIGDNHLGDWGTQFGMILYGYKNFRDDAAYQADPVTELARLYRTVNTLSDYHAAKKKRPKLTEVVEAKRQAVADAPPPADKKAKKALSKLKQEAGTAEEALAAADAKIAAVEADTDLAALAAAHPTLAAESRAETAKLHAGDAENRRLWEEFLPPCLAALQTIYDRLGIQHDATYGESFYQPMLAGVVDELLEKGIAEESDGAVVVRDNVDPAGKPVPGPFVVRKTDGAFLYGTTDLATVKHHVEELNADAMLYVVDSRQGDHFANVAATARRWGFNDTDFRHVSFGTVLGEDGKPFKTRSGDTIGLESLLDEAVERALAIVSENDDSKPDGPELDANERGDIAEAVGLGGIKYADLAHNRESDYKFSWDKMLSTTGNTATYMQYARARVCGIFRMGGVDRDALRDRFVADGGEVLLTDPAERAMALQLNRFAEAVREASRDHRPNVLTDYLFDTAKAFSAFYEACPLLKAETEDLKSSRLILADTTARVMHAGLELLGIRVIDRM
ncbi:arginine--tRNA ligase [Alienimonas chondri]|uniref:Arginine--tRNA ligase n=1 Tax=Alienimonas chondri TaxID=2681879 RepID=A0ABX1V9C4_9PLAN|nr:arginine--tRNA ligase [Alienimonas chondri]NNJ24702.1 Arginine--tRNA ligase [Alienimonas chondri]